MSLTIDLKPVWRFPRLYWKELLTFSSILVGVFLFRQEHHELAELGPMLQQTNDWWMLAGVALAILYIVLQAFSLDASFHGVDEPIGFRNAFRLFLKRNFLSVFLPGGNLTSMAYAGDMIRGRKPEQHALVQALMLNGFIGILTVALMAIPVLGWQLLHHQRLQGAWPALAATVLLLGGMVGLVKVVQRGGHSKLLNRFPQLSAQMAEIAGFRLKTRPLALTTGISLLIELVGVLQLYAAMLAAGVQPSWSAAFAGYVVSTLFLMISPFLKGLGAVELSLALVLKSFGYNLLQTLEITLLFRFFEFWLPFAAGALAWAWRGRHLVLRLLAPAMILVLGGVNILSVLTPPLAMRVHLLRAYIPAASIHASNWLTLLVGLMLLLTAVFLIRGLRMAWLLALVLSLLSVVGHMAKALDWEESALALLVVVLLLASRKQYRLKTDPRRLQVGAAAALTAFLLVLVFGSVGFYLLNVRHFGIDFSLKQSVSYALGSLMLLGLDELHPVTRFGAEFLVSLKLLSAGAWLVLVGALLSPLIHRLPPNADLRQQARYLLGRFGASSVDHFKVAAEQLIFLSQQCSGFVSYRVARGFAVVLEEPVCAADNKMQVLQEFEAFCKRSGLRTAFYRIDRSALWRFEALGKHKMLIGQEGIVDLSQFSLSGKEGKSLRNALNSLEKKGFTVQRHQAPLPAELLAELRQVSDAWLQAYQHKEAVFSQGAFDATELAGQDVLCLHDGGGKVVAFLNIIPDYAPGEATYDLIRKLPDAPPGAMDGLIIRLMQEAKAAGYIYLNMGLAPLSGINKPENIAERVVKYAYGRMRRFSHYHGLRTFKEKYVTRWLDKYLVYSHDFDLVQLPAALTDVMEPAPIKQDENLFLTTSGQPVADDGSGTGLRPA